MTTSPDTITPTQTPITSGPLLPPLARSSADALRFGAIPRRGLSLGGTRMKVGQRVARHSQSERPTVGFMLRHPLRWLAFGFGTGLSPWAPGTVATLWAWAAFVVLDVVLADAAWAWVLALGAPLSIWASKHTAQALGQDDPSSIVADEIWAFWAVLWVVCPAHWGWQLAAFVLFRFFDAAKPHPVRWADRRFKSPGWRGAFGIWFDDVMAAACTLVVLALARVVLG